MGERKRDVRMNLHSIRFTFSCFLYMYIGVAIFLMGWARLWWSVPALALLAFALWEYWKKLQDEGAKEKLLLHPAMLAAVGIFCLLFCLLAGQGAFFFQPGDWDKHNRVLSDLVNYPWPVCYQNGDDAAMLTYYIAQYLPPALIGKIAHSFRAAEISLLLFNALGLFGVALLLFRAVKADSAKKQAFTLLAFAFFGTCLFLAKALYGATGLGNVDVSEMRDWISNSMQIQYRTLFVCLRWAFPQAIVPWMATLLFAENQRNVGLYCLIGAPLLLCATFPFAGLAFLMAGVALYQAFSQGDLKKLFKNICSRSNIAVALAFLIPLSYILGNVLQEKTKEVGFSYVNYGRNATVYFCFAAAFLAYSVVIYKKCKDSVLFYLVNISLLALPFFRMGLYNDFTMSVSIPAVFLLLAMTLRSLFSYWKDGSGGRIYVIALVCLLAIGAIYPAEEMAEVCKEPVAWEGAGEASLMEWATRDGSVGAAEAYNYFTYDYKDSVFWRFFSKHPN